MRNTTTLIILLLALTGSLVANRTFSAPQEGVRYVNIDTCLQQWNSYKAVRDQLTAETQRLTQQLSAQSDTITAKRADLELLDPSSVTAQELLLQINIAEETLNFQNQMASRQMQERSNAAFSRALVEINQACAAVGELNGYSSILSHPADLNRVYPDSATQLNQLSGRVVNWTNPAYDVSSEVVAMLNKSTE
ncbi:MAG: Skp family chaperone for outer membrane protein [Myxococcota bacterium]|jgi:Skp family chaperone for outer membrane proteins